MTRLPTLALFACALFGCSSDDSSQSDASATSDAGTSDSPAIDQDATPDAGLITFTQTGSLHTPRSAHTATMLPNGKVLVIGGEDVQRNQIASIEQYDPGTGQWTLLGNLPSGRSNHTAVLLPNGKVLVAGGGQTDSNGLPTGTQVTDSVVLVDPSASQLITPVDSLKVGRSHHVAVVLPNGNVLVAGGSPLGGDAGKTPPPLKEAEIYDATANTWSVAPTSLTVARAMASAAVVSGKVVIAGGYTSDGSTPATVDVFDPSTQAFANAPLVGSGRVFGAMTALAGGNAAVLVGGYFFGSISGEVIDEGEVFTGGAWQSSGSIGGERDAVALVALADGRAVSLGGFTDLPSYMPVGMVATYLPKQNAWYLTGTLKTPRMSETATLLQSGQILVAGGLGASDALSSCELSSMP